LSRSRVDRASPASLANLDEQRLDWQQDLLTSIDRLSRALAIDGQTKEVIELNKKAISIAETVSKKHEGNTEWQHSIAYAYQKLGDALKANGQSDEALDA
jgi:hypothetical protein